MKYQNEDPTRRILNLIRESKLSNKKLLNEQSELTPVDQMTPSDEFETAPVEDEVNNNEDQLLEGADLTEEEDKFKQNVHSRVKFNKFKLYPNSLNVEWSGQFTDSRIEWNYSLDDTLGVYISCELTQVRDETLTLLKKLNGYYKTWSEDWASRISNEYKPKEENNNEGGLEPGDDLPEEPNA